MIHGHSNYVNGKCRCEICTAANAAYQRQYMNSTWHRRFVIRWKAAKGCECCGFRDPRALDCHHIGEKTWSVAYLVRRGGSRKRLKAELRKCVVLCANCHRIEHSTGKVA